MLDMSSSVAGVLCDCNFRRPSSARMNPRRRGSQCCLNPEAPSGPHSVQSEPRWACCFGGSPRSSCLSSALNHDAEGLVWPLTLPCEPVTRFGVYPTVRSERGSLSPSGRSKKVPWTLQDPGSPMGEEQGRWHSLWHRGMSGSCSLNSAAGQSRSPFFESLWMLPWPSGVPLHPRPPFHSHCPAFHSRPHPCRPDHSDVDPSPPCNQQSLDGKKKKKTMEKCSKSWVWSLHLAQNCIIFGWLKMKAFDHQQLTHAYLW